MAAAFASQHTADTHSHCGCVCRLPPLSARHDRNSNYPTLCSTRCSASTSQPPREHRIPTLRNVAYSNQTLVTSLISFFDSCAIHCSDNLSNMKGTTGVNHKKSQSAAAVAAAVTDVAEPAVANAGVVNAQVVASAGDGLLTIPPGAHASVSTIGATGLATASAVEPMTHASMDLGQEWDRNPPLRDVAPSIAPLNIFDYMIRFGCLAYTDTVCHRDSRMYQALALIEHLQKRPTGVASCPNQQADHVIVLAREHFDHIRQIVTATNFDASRAELHLRHTEWPRICELYHSIRELQEEHACLGKLHRWPMLSDIAAPEENHRQPLPGEVGADAGGAPDAITRIHQAVDVVCKVTQDTVPSHVFILGAVPPDTELEYFGLLGMRRRDLYAIFHTSKDLRDVAVDRVISAVGNIGIPIAPPADGDVKLARGVGFCVHEMVVELRRCKERALRCQGDNTTFLEALEEVCGGAVGDGVLAKLWETLAACKKISADRTWARQFDDALYEFRKACSPPSAPSPCSISEACSHFVNGTLMPDHKEAICALAKALVTDVLADPLVAPKSTEEHHMDVLGTTLVLDVKDIHADRQGQYVVTAKLATLR